MAMGCNFQENRTELRSCALNLEVGNREGTPGRDGRRRRLGGWNAFGALGLRLPPSRARTVVSLLPVAWLLFIWSVWTRLPSAHTPALGPAPRDLVS